jgi:molybdopterin/thiamine biosynthesis adenylyltransferase
MIPRDDHSSLGTKNNVFKISGRQGKMEIEYKRPRIKPIYPIYKLKDNLFRIGAQRGITVEFGDEYGQLWDLVNFLDGTQVKDVIKKMQSKYPQLSDLDVINGIHLLNKEGLIEEYYEEYESFSERLKPNINYFSHYLSVDNSRCKIQKKISESEILLLGLGGGGSNILTMLAGLSPKRIVIVDYDKIEEANLGRQLLYKENDIGKLKCDVAKKAIEEINSSIKIEAHNKKITCEGDVTELLDEIDLVICAIDEPPFLIQRIVNKAIVKANIPCVFGASQVSRGRVFTVIPHETGCYDCLHIHYTKQDPKYILQFSGFQKIDFKPPTIAYAPAIYQLTAVIVDEAVRVLTGYAKPRSLSTQLEINYEDYSSFCLPSWKRYATECPTCGSGSEENWDFIKGDML